MREELLQYYERELSYLRRSGAEFAEKYPKIAARLELEANKCDDPHVERLLEGFAFLAARVHLKLDDDFPEISEALLEVLYPQYVRPIPAMSVAQFHMDPGQGKVTSGVEVPRGSELYTRPVSGAPCKFRTCYDTHLWPLSVTEAVWGSPQQLGADMRGPDTVAALRIELRCPEDVAFEELELETLRFHLDAQLNVATTLYEVLFNNCPGVLMRPLGTDDEPVRLPAAALQPVGFEEDQGVLPLPRRAFLPYRLLTEYFVFPEKYLFFDVDGFGEARSRGWEEGVELVFPVSSFERSDRAEFLETSLSDDTFRLGCSPVVNLFTRTSEPVLLDQRRQEYTVVADARRPESVRIHSVQEVEPVTSGRGETTDFAPFHAFRHGGGDGRVFWYAKRRSKRWRPDEEADVALSMVDLSHRTVHPDVDAVTARLTCFNGDLPGQLPFGSEDGDFELAGGGAVDRVVALSNPTDVVQPPLGKPELWRLISQLGVNFVSLAEGGPEALQEILRLHNFGEDRAAEKQIEGLLELDARPTYARIESEHGLTFARGHRLELTFDEDQFAGGGVFLFASVLERFLGMSVSMNSFVTLAVRTRQRKELLREWAPRAGGKPLL